MVGGGVVKAGTHEHSVIHQSGCSRPAVGSFVNGYWLYRYEYFDVSVIVCGCVFSWPFVFPSPFWSTPILSGASIPPPAGASGIAYRIVIAFARCVSVKATYWPGASFPACRPTASPDSV